MIVGDEFVFKLNNFSYRIVRFEGKDKMVCLRIYPLNSKQQGLKYIFSETDIPFMDFIQKKILKVLEEI